jgi:NitT/TauT family transport system substrate-binding protein
VLVKQLVADIKNTFLSEETKAYGIGWMTSSRWKETARVLTEQGVLTQPLDIETAYNNSFLSNAHPARR